nr:sigma factor-like helix-turn-helix DNA-binding protein [Microvirga sp. VF16]
MLKNITIPEGPQDGALGPHDVHTGLDPLPEEQRSVHLLIGIEDLSYDEAAQVPQVPISTVRFRLSRVREEMRQYLETDRGLVLRRVK